MCDDSPHARADGPATLAYPRQVHYRPASLTLAGLVVALAAVLPVPPGAVATPAPTPPAPSVTTHAVPPRAPQPTSQAQSPDAPDPNPPRGGIGPLGEPVGGKRLLGRGVVLPAHAPALPDGLTARAWVLVDLDSGDVLAAQDPHGRYQPASILKTLTSATLIPLLPGGRVVTVSPAAAAAEGSHAGLFPHGRYTVDQLFSGLLLVSGNDTAAALADAAGGYQHTVALMNQDALALGAYDTYVQTPSGLDGWQQLTSAYDMALFLRAAVDLPRFVAYCRQPTATLPEQHTDYGGYDPVTLVNQNNRFLTTVPGALVAKTGFTDAAQHTFVGVAQRHGRRLGVVFLRAQRWPTDQWQQASALIDWGFALPRGTAPVGHLDAAVPPPAPTTSSAGHPTSRSASTVARAGHVTEPHWLGIGAGTGLALLLAGAGTMLWRRASR